MKFIQDINKLGEYEDRKIENWKLDYVVFLLGSGYPQSALDLRIKTKEVLDERGYNIIVMELLDEAPKKDDTKELANKKFRRILKDYKPNLFLILICQSLPAASGVTYEVGIIVEKCIKKYGEEMGIQIASDIIRICCGKNVDMKKALPTYIRELKEIVIREYDDDDFDDMVAVLEDTIIDSIIRFKKG